ncbi:MAG: 23S rRNA (guanosine(2251)-2'-O)-methyltransferase RlmB [Anaerolineae bacterium]|nr:23S rRNA (guanosine(2251)-2'-O)-methyltransferase RlmB [Anaerolineae bacterium]
MNPLSKDKSQIEGDHDPLYGRRPVLESLRAGRRAFHSLLIAEGVKLTDAVQELIDRAKVHNARISRVPRPMLNDLAHTPNHQGIVLRAGSYPYIEIEDILAHAEALNEPPFVLLLDLLQDPQNVGALLRVAEAVGVHGVVIQERRAVDITPAVVSASAGAVEHLLVAQATNLVAAMKQLKEAGVWLAAMEAGPTAQPIDRADLKGAIGLVLGGEGEGLRRLVRETCDFFVQLPMRGRVESLNVATAGAVGLYAVWQARGWQGWDEFAEDETLHGV